MSHEVRNISLNPGSNEQFDAEITRKRKINKQREGKKSDLYVCEKALCVYLVDAVGLQCLHFFISKKLDNMPII